MKRIFKIIYKTVKWGFIVFCLYLSSLFFRTECIPGSWVEKLGERFLPKSLVLHIGSLRFGFRDGLKVVDLRLYNGNEDTIEPMITLASGEVHPIAREIILTELKYPRLPHGYYEPGNTERNQEVDGELPLMPRWSLTLVRPEILGVAPRRVVADVEIADNRLSVSRIHLDWPDRDDRMSLDGFCNVDLEEQRIYGEVRGNAKQHHIRPLLVAVDVPVALPYMDGFTDVPGPVPAYCGWNVNLVNNDFDMDLDLKPNMGRYNFVPMKWAAGKIHLHVYTRDDCLNYHQTFGPITGENMKGKTLDGTVIVDSTNGYNTVSVKAKSAMPVIELLKIGGFTGEYVEDGVIGDSDCDICFRFPRTMDGDYDKLNGGGHLEIKNGQIMRMRGFKGLLELLADKVPGFSMLTDSTQASCDYVIENGVLESNNIYIEGTVFSIKMSGAFDCVKNALDFTVRVQFTKKDSLAGRILHPLTWPFTKLLLEFKLTGTSEEPKWRYISVLDRVMEATR